MMTVGFHYATKVEVRDLYPSQPGNAINVKIADDKGNEIILFMDDKSIKLLGAELATYAASRTAPPVEPAPSYAETLFVAKPSPQDDYDKVPF